MKKLCIALVCMSIISCKQEKTAEPTTNNTPIETAQPAEDPISNTSETTTTEADPIAEIRQKVEHINTATLTKKHFEFMCDEKMKVDYFYEGKEIVKISVDFGTVGDTYAREDYYYNAGRIIFNYEFVEGGPACEGCITTNEYRSYIVDNKTIQYLKNKTQQPCRKCEFKNADRQYKLLKTTTEKEVKSVLCKGIE